MSPGFPVALKVSVTLLGITTLLAVALINASASRVSRRAGASDHPAVTIVSETAAFSRVVAPNARAFGFLEFDWDPSGGNGVPGFDTWPASDGRQRAADGRI
jgi:hypothetical protein